MSRPRSRRNFAGAGSLVRLRKRAAKSYWTPVFVLGGFAAFVGIYSWFVGGVPLLTKIYNRGRADGSDARLQAFLTWWEQNGPFPITVGYDGGVRTLEKQQELYAKGRTTKGEPPYTAEKPLGSTVTDANSNVNSPHGHAAALDLYPVNALGKAMTNAADPETLAKFQTIGTTAKAMGFAWGGDWKRLDYPHIEIVGWANLPVVGQTTATV